jgi:hypothetical protein
MEAVRPSLAEHKLLINSAEILFIQRKFELHRGSRGGGMGYLLFVLRILGLAISLFGVLFI